MHVENGLFRHIEALLAKDRSGWISVQFPLDIQREPVVGRNGGGHIEFTAENVPLLEVHALQEVVLEVVDLDDEHANYELYQEHLLVLDCVLGLLLLAPSRHRI